MQMQPKPDLLTKPVARENWADLEKLFEGRGGPKYCWCTAWRPLPKPRSAADNSTRKQALHQQLLGRTPIGLLGYANDEPVAWCSVGPRSAFLRLRDDQQDEAEVWSVTCFFIRRDHRGKRWSGLMLDAAVELARHCGAKAVEGYPVDPNSPSYRFMGFLPLFQQRGFREVARGARGKPAAYKNNRRHQVELHLIASRL
jgi:GNAT superfamily N-acetyltransferase